MSEEDFFSEEDLLKPENMILLYARGAFPMADENGCVDWYMPETRTIIPLDKYNIPRSLKKFMSQSNFEYKIDSCTLQVIEKCAARSSTWISKELIDAYKNLIKLGYVHSVEVFQSDNLVGGLYGVTYRGAFFGESMFSTVPQASKCALAKLLEHLDKKNFVLLDVQYQTDHLKMFGSIEIPFDEFSLLLLKSYGQNVDFL